MKPSPSNAGQIARTGWLALLLVIACPALGQNQNVTVDDQPTAEQRLNEVKALRAAGRLDEAVGLIQEITDRSQFKLVGVGEGLYADIERWCREQLFRDRALQQAYRERFTASATRAYEQAMAEDEPARALAGVYRRYGVTRPGFDAGLMVAGWMLESGEAASAGSLIDELVRHPDHGLARPRLLMLRGAVAVFRQDAEQVKDVRDELTELGQAGLAEWVAGLAASLQPGAIAEQAGVADVGEKPEEIHMALWDQPLSSAERSPRWVLKDTASVPALTPSLVLINNGRQVVALDRASGQRAWVYPTDDSDAVQSPPTGQRWYDERSVGLGGGAVCAVLGESYGITENRNPYVPPNALVCIDRETGQPLWQRTAGVINDDEPTRATDRRAGRVNLQYTHFVGTPIVSRGTVLATLRRANSQGTQSTWLLAFDLADGSLLWYRHLSLLSLSYSRDAMYVTPQLTLHGDTVYLTDSVATVGAIDLHTGGYRWLRVLPVGFGQSQRLTVRTEGTLAPPVPTRSGLLVSIALSQTRLALLDPEDGSLLQDFENDPQLSGAQYILDAGDGALVVSSESVSYWSADEAAVAWTFTMQPDESITGRADVTRQYAIVPTNRRLLVLSRATGELVESSRAVTGSVVVDQGDVFAVNEKRLHSYTTWDRVHDRLIERVKQLPEDPSAGLALASLAMRQEGRSDAVLQGVSFALQAVDRQPLSRAVPIRRRVFDQLRQLALQTSDDTLRRTLIARMALVTETATQEAAYHLDAGRFFAEQGEALRAVDHFHAVLAEADFAAQPYELGGVTRQAGVLAQRQIEQLIERFGRSVYARQDALARARLEELKSGDTIDAAALTAIARSFPLSLAAVDVLLEAADTRYAQARHLEAAGLYQQAVVRANSTAQRQRAVGRLLAFYLDRGRPDLAQGLLNNQTQRYPELYPIDEGKPLAPDQWRQRIDQAEAAERPSPGDLSASIKRPIVLPGRVIAPAPGLRLAPSVDRLYLLQPNRTITRHDAADPGQAVWTAVAPPLDSAIYLLADQSDQVLFWATHPNVLFAVDPATGKTLWTTEVGFGSLRAFDPLANTGVVGDDDSPRGLMAAVSQTVVCIGEAKTARVVTLDRASGGVLWKTQFDMAELTAIDADNWTLAAVGRAGNPQQLRSGKLALLGLFTAEPVMANTEQPIGLSPIAVRLDRGRAIVNGPSGVMAIDQNAGRVLWTRRFTETRLTGPLVMDGRLLAVKSTDGMVHLMDANENGRLLERVLVRNASDSEEVGLAAADGRVWVRAGRGLFCLDGEPGVRWRDALAATGLEPRRLLVGKDHAALIATKPPKPPRPGIGHALLPTASLFIFEADGGRLVNEYDLGPIGLLQPQLLGRGFAVSSGEQTLFFAGGSE